MAQTRKSFCRFCHVFCGIEVDVEDGRVVAVRGDPDNAVTRGYTCAKGRAEVERIHHPDRLLAPRKRVADGWRELAAEQALDEIAESVWLKSRRVGILDHVPTDLVERVAPDLVQHAERIAKHPGVAAYYAG